MKPSSADCERFGRFVTAMQGEFDAAADLYASMRREATEMFVQLYEHQGVQGVTALEAADKGAMKLHTVEEWIEIAAQDPAPKVAMVPLGRVHSVGSNVLWLHAEHDVKPGDVLAASYVNTERDGMPVPPLRTGRLHVAHVHRAGALVLREDAFHAIPALQHAPATPSRDPLVAVLDGHVAARREIERQRLALWMKSSARKHLINELQVKHAASSAAPEPPDPLDVKYDGVALRVLLEIDVCRRRESAWHAMRNGLTDAQRAAVSAHWSAELRAKVEAGKRADAARATSVVLDCAEEL